MGNRQQTEAAAEIAQKARADCLRMVAHDLGNPLTAIKVLAEILREDVDDARSRQDALDVLEAADLACAILEGMASMLMLESEDDEMTWFPIDMVQVLRRVVDRPALRRRVQLDLPRELHLAGDRRALARAFTDVLVNALRLTDQTSPVTISIRNRTRECSVVVSHAPPGIPREMRDALIEPFGAVQLRRKRIPALATGLVYAHHIFVLHGGGVTFEDTEDGGMDVVCRLTR